MVRLLILFGTLALAVLFQFLRPDTGLIGFPFSAKQIYADSYVYFVMEHIITILFVVVIWELDTMFRVAISILLALEFIDLIDFVLTYNSPWFKFVSINTFKVFVFGLAIAYEKLWAKG